MTPLDAAFLQGEDEESGVSLAIGSLAVFEGPAPDMGQVTGAVRDRLALIPRYRQKVREIPLDLGPPVWIDDHDFDLAYHLHRTAVPTPGGDAELADLMARIMSDRLDRSRPLWEIWLVEGLAEQRWALLSKVHHCMADGIAGTGLFHVLLDSTAVPGPAVPDEWHPGPEPTGLALAAAALGDLARLPVRQARGVARMARSPATLALQAGAALRGLASLASALRPATASSLTGPTTAHRRFAYTRTTSRDVSTIRHALGGTFNDVILAAVTAGYRRLLLGRGEPPSAHTVRTLVPVSLRAPGAETVLDNEISLLLAELPVQLTDPVERLVAVRHELARLKRSREAAAGAAVLRIAAAEPFPAIALGVRLSAHLRQRFVVTVTTDVPGPRAPLYALGRPLLEIIPFVPIASTLRIGVAVFSYCGQVALGVTGDAQGGDDVWTLARGFEDGMQELLAAAAGQARATATFSAPDATGSSKMS